jgi:hypothetical protein
MSGHPTFQCVLHPKENGAHKQWERAENLKKKEKDVKGTRPIMNHALQDCQMEHNTMYINGSGR